MAYWLLKTEPDCYAWDDLVRDKSAVWDGITNPLALKYLTTVKKGDMALVYHTGDERSAVGIAEVRSNPYPDPKEHDDRLAVVDLRPRQRLPRHVSLSDIKADPAFAGWELIRNGRLGVVPVPPAMWDRILDLAGAGATTKLPRSGEMSPAAPRRKPKEANV